MSACAYQTAVPLVLASEIEHALYAHSLFVSVRVNDARLADHFGVSRTATRDVLVRMHSLGLIVKDDAGHWVAHRVTARRIHDLFELRQLIEPVALVQAAPHLPPQLLQAVRARVTDALAERTVGSAQFDRIERDLHTTVLSFATNQELAPAARRTAFLFGPTRHLVDPLLGIGRSTIKDALEEHLLIIDTLLDNGPVAAASFLRVHVAAAANRWIQRLEFAAGRTQPKLPNYLRSV